MHLFLHNKSTPTYYVQKISIPLLGDCVYNFFHLHCSLGQIVLRTIMIPLHDPEYITLEVFHVFRGFCGESKYTEVLRILTNNKVRLITYSGVFHKQKEEIDRQLRDVLNILSTLTTIIIMFHQEALSLVSCIQISLEQSFLFL